ncbi:probable G-protein coupled receptor Mth-like 3 isoform X2 [Bacillus rossius redtenbacheri]|uniref:probable G-protein coupled receptor Mth-like 3 isoform X2 n=1 Tax=Bacillus rossius redtenbacheri TaxID=93214 RepID=UPI002FDD63C0
MLEENSSTVSRRWFSDVTFFPARDVVRKKVEMFALVLVLSSARALEPVFLKCCPFDRQLDVSFQRCVGHASTGGEGSARHPWWLPQGATALSAETREAIPGFFSDEDRFLGRVGDEGYVFCGSSSANVFVDPEDFAYLDDGSLLDRATRRLLPPRSFCADGVSLAGGEEVSVVTSCPCEFLPCLRRCCPPGHALSVARGSSNCEPGAADGEDELWPVGFADGVNPGDFAVVHGTNFCGPSAPMYTLSRTAVTAVQADGSLEVQGSAPVPPRRFCAARDRVMACGAGAAAVPGAVRLYGALSVLGAAFLAATLLVQLMLPQRGGHARHLVAHTSSLLAFYVALSAGQLGGRLPHLACCLVAYTIQFSFLAAIFWLNVMCIDIAWSFSSFHVPRSNFMKCQKKRFILYSLYAWGSCVIISVVTIVMELSPAIPESAIKPEFGRKYCWFGSDMATLVYFYGPVSCLLLGNLVLFVYTVVRILKMRRSTAVLRQSESAYHRGKVKEEEKVKKRFMLYLKLFCLMGVTWTMEVVSWAAGGPGYYWYATDVINVLRAAFVFAIFCCKHEVLARLQSRLNALAPWCVPRPGMARGGGGEPSSSERTDSSRCAARCSGKSPRKKSSLSNIVETSA